MVVYPFSELDDNEKKETWDRKHKLHKQLEAATFVQIVDIWDEATYKVLLLDYCVNGSVELMLKTRKYLHQTEVMFVMKKILECIKYMRRKRIIHRNISLSHIYLTEAMQVKLGNFDQAVKLLEDTDKRSSPVGRIIYQSPQMIEDKGYSFDVDMWAFGICLYYLLTGAPPFYQSNKS